MKTISNQHKEFHKIDGLLSFGSFTPHEIHKHFRGDVIYCPEEDDHFPTLTVLQTLQFAARMRCPGKEGRLAGMSRDDYVNAVNCDSEVFI